MVNRILIRMKVVQMLYSYLLTRSRFNILPSPETTSRDKRFAYSLYSQMLLLLLDQAGYRIKVDGDSVRVIAPDRQTAGQPYTRIAAALATNEELRPIIIANRSWIDALAPLRGAAQGALKEASIFKEYTRKRTPQEIDDEARLWKTLMRTVILRDKGIDTLIRTNPDFTINGYNEALGMFDATLDEYADVRSSLADARKSLTTSLDKAYELYHYLLQLMIDLTRLRELQLDEARHKYLPTHDDLNPNLKFVQNRFIAALSQNPDMRAYTDQTPISWIDDDVTLRRLLDRILKSEAYINYMADPDSSLEKDAELWYTLFKTIIADSDELAEALETLSVYWNDDLVIMGSFVLKTIRRFANCTDGNTDAIKLMPKYKDLEDERFGPKLFDAAVAHQQEYRSLIDSRLEGSAWDPERLAFMDIVILEAAISELLNFPSIPTIVTVNEYTEIANYYSTPKSGQFITGMLYGIINSLKADGTLIKE